MNFASMVARLRTCGRIDVAGCSDRACSSRFAQIQPRRRRAFQPLEIVTKSGVQVFSVEMATTEEEKTTGLMYRKELAGR